jgi:hypothetical protein
MAPRSNAQAYEFSVFAGLARADKRDLGSLLIPGARPGARDDDTSLRTSTGMGVRVTKNTRGYYGHEVSYFRRSADVTTHVLDDAQVRAARNFQTTVQQISYDFLMYMMPAKETWRPYIAVGMHVAQFEPLRVDLHERSGSRPIGFQFGGGIKFLIAKRGIFRLDIRDHRGGSPWGLSFAHRLPPASPRIGAGRLRTLEASIGIGLAF